MIGRGTTFAALASALPRRAIASDSLEQSTSLPASTANEPDPAELCSRSNLLHDCYACQEFGFSHHNEPWRLCLWPARPTMRVRLWTAGPTRPYVRPRCQLDFVCDRAVLAEIPEEAVLVVADRQD